MPDPSPSRPHPARRGDTDSFRRLVERQISADEYVKSLERRVDERRKNGGTNGAQTGRRRS